MEIKIGNGCFCYKLMDNAVFESPVTGYCCVWWDNSIGIVQLNTIDTWNCFINNLNNYTTKIRKKCQKYYNRKLL